MDGNHASEIIMNDNSDISYFTESSDKEYKDMGVPDNSDTNNDSIICWKCPAMHKQLHTNHIALKVLKILQVCNATKVFL